MVPGRHRLPRCSQAEATSTAPTRATWPLETQGTKTKLQIGPKGPDVNKSHFLPSTSPHFHGDSWSDSHSSRTLKGREDFHTERPGTGQRHSDQGKNCWIDPRRQCGQKFFGKAQCLHMLGCWEMAVAEGSAERVLC
uniref:Uncharacterized protein n=1 Tax=Rousettus aegyptiacus TaxID=9407 RepID=A0A7J8KAU7_ROUAE|nr:hypothetical protein HJG63_007826 [Rousettus aegyptiacus]